MGAGQLPRKRFADSLNILASGSTCSSCHKGLCHLPAAGLSFPLKKDYERVNMELFDPRIVNEDYFPHEEAA